MDPATEVRRTFKRRVKGYVMQYVTDTTEILLKLGWPRVQRKLYQTLFNGFLALVVWY
jgi:hypothetical protein